MRCPLLSNLLALALFCGITGYAGLWSWELLVFQLVVQMLTNEFWTDVFCLPFKGQHLFGARQNSKVADPARLRRVARWTSPCLLVLPALCFVGLFCINDWGEGALGRALHLPLGGSLFLPSLAAQGLLLASTLIWGAVPLSYKTLIEALLARRERELAEEGPAPATAGTRAAAAPSRAGVDMLPHGLPEGYHVPLPACLQEPQRCSPLHGAHAELVRTHLREGERAILSTAPAGVVALPSSSNERLLGGALLCLAALLLYTGIGLFEENSTHLITRWAVVILGFTLLPISIRILRAAARRQALLQRTDYFITNRRLHICQAGEWEAVALVSMEVIPGGSYGEEREDIVLCPESGAQTYAMVNVEHPAELAEVLERVISLENAR